MISDPYQIMLKVVPPALYPDVTISYMPIISLFRLVLYAMVYADQVCGVKYEMLGMLTTQTCETMFLQFSVFVPG